MSILTAVSSLMFAQGTERPSAAARPPPERPTAASCPLAQLVTVLLSPTVTSSLHGGCISLRLALGCLSCGRLFLLLCLGGLGFRADRMKGLQRPGRGQLTQCQRSRLSLVTWILAELMAPPTIFWASPGAAVWKRSQAEVQRHICTVRLLCF